MQTRPTTASTGATKLGNEGICWCTSSDAKCPHNVTTKLTKKWSELENAVDQVFSTFDQKSVRKFLKRDLLGQQKVDLAGKLREVYKNGPIMSRPKSSTTTGREQLLVEAPRGSRPDSALNNRSSKSSSPLKAGRPNMNMPGESNQTMYGYFERSIQVDNNTGKALFEREEGRNNRRPVTAGSAVSRSGRSITPLGSDPRSNQQQQSNLVMSASLNALPRGGALIAQIEPSDNQRHFEAAAASTAPLTAAVVSSFKTRLDEHIRAQVGAGGSDSLDPSETYRQRNTSGGHTVQGSDADKIGAGGLLTDVEHITASIVRVADALVRKVLPWQATACPRAVEYLKDLRQMVVQSKNDEFITRMTSQLQEKVLTFCERKEKEVDTWIDNELSLWKHAVAAEDSSLKEFITSQREFMQERFVAQNVAYHIREAAMAASLDSKERIDTRDQLIKYRNICRSDVQSEEPELRVLKSSFEAAEYVATMNVNIASREHLRMTEDAFDWLRCVADNAMVAEESESTLKDLCSALDVEQERSFDSLKSAMDTYITQHNAIVDAIDTFAAKIRRHKVDFIRREVLVLRSFLQFILGVLSSDATAAVELRRDSVGWETKLVLDRCRKKETILHETTTKSMLPFENVCQELKKRLKKQLGNVTRKMQHAMQGREGEIQRRKERVHRKLAKHVNKLCNSRRRQLKQEVGIRKSEFFIEEQTLSSVSSMTVQLRGAVDQLWIKYHVHERHMFEASTGRLARLQRNAEETWAKHTQCADSREEEYKEWLHGYVMQRDKLHGIHRSDREKEWRFWRNKYGDHGMKMSVAVNDMVQRIIDATYSINTDVTVEDDRQRLVAVIETSTTDALKYEGIFLKEITQFKDRETELSQTFSDECREALLKDWETNIARLNRTVNNRIATLKTLEGELERALRMALLQNEVDSTIFEQTSCSQFEGFWDGWKRKLNKLQSTLDGHISEYKQTKEVLGFVNNYASLDAVEDAREVDAVDALLQARTSRKSGPAFGLPFTTPSPNELMDVPQLPTTDPMTSARPGTMTEKSTINRGRINDPSLTEIQRLQFVLGSVKLFLFDEFFESVKNQVRFYATAILGDEGVSVPAFAVFKSLISSAYEFWERAQLSVALLEASEEGLYAKMPDHAQVLFCIGTSLAILSSFLVSQEGSIDTQEFLTRVQEVGTGGSFLSGLVLMTMSIGTFGESMMKSEIVWACSSCGITPPAELSAHINDLQTTFGSGADTDTDAQGPMDAPTAEFVISDRSGRGSSRPTTPSRASPQRQQKRPGSAAAAATSASASSSPSKRMWSAGRRFPEPSPLADPIDLVNSIIGLFEDHGNRNRDDDSFLPVHVDVTESFSPLTVMLKKMDKAGFPAADITALSSILGRPYSLLETTPRRFAQAVILWRKAALSLLMVKADPPVMDISRLEDELANHKATKKVQSAAGWSNVVCMSPFEAVDNLIDWSTSIVGVPLSILQSISLVTKGGSCDPWIEDPQQSNRSERFVILLREMLSVYFAKKTFIPDDSTSNFVVTLQEGFEDTLNEFDIDTTQVFPLELLRTYLHRDNPDISNAQMTVAFWSVCRNTVCVDEEKEGEKKEENEVLVEGGERPGTLVASRSFRRPPLSSSPSTDTNTTISAPNVSLGVSLNSRRSATGLRAEVMSSRDLFLKEHDQAEQRTASAIIPLSMMSDDDDTAAAAATSRDSRALARLSSHTTTGYFDFNDSSRLQEYANLLEVRTEFSPGVNSFLLQFARDVTAFLHVPPQLDSGSVLGLLYAPLLPFKANEIVLAATKLDPSARNVVPKSCVIWLGVELLPLKEAIQAISINSVLQVGQSQQRKRVIGRNSSMTLDPITAAAAERHNHHNNSNSKSINNDDDGGGSGRSPSSSRGLAISPAKKLQSMVEINTLARYRATCEQIAADAQFGSGEHTGDFIDPFTAKINPQEIARAAAGEVVQNPHQRTIIEDITERRFKRIDHLAEAWRDTTMNEWANSLYQSRGRRYSMRTEIVKNSFAVYRSRYDELRDSIIEERGNLVAQFGDLDKLLVDCTSEDGLVMEYLTSFLALVVTRTSELFTQAVRVLTGVLVAYQEHCGRTRRDTEQRLVLIRQRLATDFKDSSAAFFHSFSAGPAAVRFETLSRRTQQMVNSYTKIHEVLMGGKAEVEESVIQLEKDATEPIVRRIAFDRNSTKHLMDELHKLSEDVSAKVNQILLEDLNKPLAEAHEHAMERVSDLQQESSRLLSEAEELPLERLNLLAKLRTEMTFIRNKCKTVLDRAQEEATAVVQSVYRFIDPHKDLMTEHVDLLLKTWRDSERLLTPVITNMESAFQQYLDIFKVKVVEAIGAFSDAEDNLVEDLSQSENKALLQDFRTYFSTQSLAEESLLDRYNNDLKVYAAEFKRTWGSVQPAFMTSAIHNLDKLVQHAISELTEEALVSTGHKTKKSRKLFNVPDNNKFASVSKLIRQSADDLLLQRMEIIDIFCSPLHACRGALIDMPDRYYEERKDLLDEIDSLNTSRTGDSVTPQVASVLDSIVSGVEIGAALSQGYEDLVKITKSKTGGTMAEFSEFAARHADPGKHGSNAHRVSLLMAKINQRQEEVLALTDAANSFIIADINRIDLAAKRAEVEATSFVASTLDEIDNAIRKIDDQWTIDPEEYAKMVASEMAAKTQAAIAAVVVAAQSVATKGIVDSLVALHEEARVEVNYKGRDRYFPGTITKDHGNGTYDVAYDDGETETGVKKELIRLPVVAEDVKNKSSTGAEEEEDDTSFVVCARVRVNYKGRGWWYCATVTGVDSGKNNVYAVEYDDGEVELQVNSRLIRAVDLLAVDDDESGLPRGPAARRFEDGERVEVDYKSRGSYYPGKVSSYREHDGGGSYDIAYDDGESELYVPPSLIRCLPPPPKFFKVGARVEGNYHGHGSWYPGSILAHANNNNDDDRKFDILYENGETSYCVPVQYIRHFVPTEKPADGSEWAEFEEGDLVDADREDRVLAGTVVKKRADDKYLIVYNNNTVEDFVHAQYIRPFVKPARNISISSDHHTTGATAAGGSDAVADAAAAGLLPLLEGTRVEADYRQFGKWYPGTISRTRSDNTYDIFYDDDGYEANVRRDFIRILETSANAATTAATNTTDGATVAPPSTAAAPLIYDNVFSEGQFVEAEFKNGLWRKAKILRAWDDGTYAVGYVEYEGGKSKGEPHKSPPKMRKIDLSKIVALGELYKVGDKVELLKYHDSNNWSVGTILRFNTDDGTFDVSYSEEESGVVIGSRVDASLIRPLVSKDVLVRVLVEGAKVEARYRGRGKYFPGKISKVHGDGGTFDIAYDDGECESTVDGSLIRPLFDGEKVKVSSEEAPPAGGSVLVAGLVEGAKVEANYKGRGKYYPGKISKVHDDGGTFDIAYDDGESESCVDASLIRPLFDGEKVKVSSEEALLAGGSVLVAGLVEGSKVEANYKARGKYYPGKISKVHGDGGTFDVAYDDGESESCVEGSLIRLLEDKAEAAAVATPTATTIIAATTAVAADFPEGAQVEARYKGGVKYFRGTITRKRLNGSYDVAYSDGDVETMVGAEFIRLLLGEATSVLPIGDEGSEVVLTNSTTVSVSVAQGTVGEDHDIPGPLPRPANNTITTTASIDDHSTANGSTPGSISSSLARSSSVVSEYRKQARDGVEIVVGGISLDIGDDAGNGSDFSGRSVRRGTVHSKHHHSHHHQSSFQDSLRPTTNTTRETSSVLSSSASVEICFGGVSVEVRGGSSDHRRSKPLKPLPFKEAAVPLVVPEGAQVDIIPPAQASLPLPSLPLPWPNDLTVGTRVEARYRSGLEWFPGVISAIHHSDLPSSSSDDEQVYDILYDDGDDEQFVSRVKVRHLEGTGEVESQRHYLRRFRTILPGAGGVDVVSEVKCLDAVAPGTMVDARSSMLVELGLVKESENVFPARVVYTLPIPFSTLSSHTHNVGAGMNHEFAPAPVTAATRTALYVVEFELHTLDIAPLDELKASVAEKSARLKGRCKALIQSTVKDYVAPDLKQTPVARAKSLLAMADQIVTHCRVFEDVGDDDKVIVRELLPRSALFTLHIPAVPVHDEEAPPAVLASPLEVSPYLDHPTFVVPFHELPVLSVGTKVNAYYGNSLDAYPGKIAKIIPPMIPIAAINGGNERVSTTTTATATETTTQHHTAVAAGGAEGGGEPSETLYLVKFNDGDEEVSSRVKLRLASDDTEKELGILSVGQRVFARCAAIDAAVFGTVVNPAGDASPGSFLEVEFDLEAYGKGDKVVREKVKRRVIVSPCMTPATAAAIYKRVQQAQLLLQQQEEGVQDGYQARRRSSTVASADKVAVVAAAAPVEETYLGTAIIETINSSGSSSQEGIKSDGGSSSLLRSQQSDGKNKEKKEHDSAAAEAAPEAGTTTVAADDNIAVGAADEQPTPAATPVTGDNVAATSASSVPTLNSSSSTVAAAVSTPSKPDTDPGMDQDKESGHNERERLIAEYKDDIDDLSNFLKSVGLSKTTSRNVAIAAVVVKKIDTPKKMAKVWNRNELDLLSLGMDQDDADEVAQALREILSITTPGRGISSQASASTFSSVQQQQPQPQTPYPVGYGPVDANGRSFHSNAYSDSVLLGQVEEEGGAVGAPYDPNVVWQPTQYTNGWVEAYTDDNYHYFYNNYTGESVWELPDGVVPLSDTGAGYPPVNNIDGGVKFYNDGEQVPGWQTQTFPITQGEAQEGREDLNPPVVDPSSGYTQEEEAPVVDPAVGEIPENYDYGYTYDYEHHDGAAAGGGGGAALNQSFSSYISRENSISILGSGGLSKEEEGGVGGAGEGGGEGSISNVPSTSQRAPPTLSSGTTVVPEIQEVITYTKEEGVVRQSVLQGLQDRWQNAFVRTQFLVAEQQTKYQKSQKDMAGKVRERVDSRIAAFVDAIKELQRVLKTDLSEMTNTEIELTRLLKDPAASISMAEKLTYTLEKLETLRETATHKKFDAVSQIEKFELDWAVIQTELYQMGDIYDESVVTSLEQLKTGCELTVKEFARDQFKTTAEVKRHELGTMKKSMRRTMVAGVVDDQNPSDEVEAVASYLRTHVEMEYMLGADYDCIAVATREQSDELRKQIDKYDKDIRGEMSNRGSEFDKHRENITKHTEALATTLDRIRTRVDEGYNELNIKIDALDYEAERLAEEELANDDDGGEVDPEVEKAIRESKEQFQLDQAIRDMRE